MTVLGIETSTAVCSVGIFREGKGTIERSLVESHIHSEKILTLVQEAVSESGTTLQQVHGVAVSIGPGSFTGLRIGLSTAKGLSYSLGCPLLAVSTFEGIAEAVRDSDPSVEELFVVLDARQGEYYAGRFHISPGVGIQTVEPVQVRRLDDLMSEASAPGKTLIVTDVPTGIVSGNVGHKNVQDVRMYCRGGNIAQLGHARLIKGHFAAIAPLEPMYLKDFVVKPR